MIPQVQFQRFEIRRSSLLCNKTASASPPFSILFVEIPSYQKSKKQFVTNYCTPDVYRKLLLVLNCRRIYCPLILPTKLNSGVIIWRLQSLYSLVMKMTKQLVKSSRHKRFCNFKISGKLANTISGTVFYVAKIYSSS